MIGKSMPIKLLLVLRISLIRLKAKNIHKFSCSFRIRIQPAKKQNEATKGQRSQQRKSSKINGARAPTQNQGPLLQINSNKVFTPQRIEGISAWIKDPKIHPLNCGVYSLNDILALHNVNVTLSELSISTLTIDFMSDIVKAGDSKLKTSLFAIKKITDAYGLNLKALKLAPQDIVKLQTPFIANFADEHFVVVTDISKDKVAYLDIGRPMSEAKAAFVSKLSGFVLASGLQKRETQDVGRKTSDERRETNSSYVSRLSSDVNYEVVPDAMQAYIWGSKWTDNSEFLPGLADNGDDFWSDILGTAVSLVVSYVSIEFFGFDATTVFLTQALSQLGSTIATVCYQEGVCGEGTAMMLQAAIVAGSLAGFASAEFIDPTMIAGLLPEGSGLAMSIAVGAAIGATSGYVAFLVSDFLNEMIGDSLDEDIKYALVGIVSSIASDVAVAGLGYGINETLRSPTDKGMDFKKVLGKTLKNSISVKRLVTLGANIATVKILDVAYTSVIAQTVANFAGHLYDLYNYYESVAIEVQSAGEKAVEEALKKDPGISPRALEGIRIAAQRDASVSDAIVIEHVKSFIIESLLAYWIVELEIQFVEGETEGPLQTDRLTLAAVRGLELLVGAAVEGFAAAYSAPDGLGQEAGYKTAKDTLTKPFEYMAQIFSPVPMVKEGDSDGQGGIHSKESAFVENTLNSYHQFENFNAMGVWTPQRAALIKESREASGLEQEEYAALISDQIDPFRSFSNYWIDNFNATIGGIIYSATESPLIRGIEYLTTIDGESHIGLTARWIGQDNWEGLKVPSLLAMSEAMGTEEKTGDILGEGLSGRNYFWSDGNTERRVFNDLIMDLVDKDKVRLQTEEGEIFFS